jgi:hypothetical protein
MKSIHLCDLEVGMIVEGRYHHRQFEVLEISEFTGRKPMLIRVRRVDDGKLTYIEGKRRDCVWRV